MKTVGLIATAALVGLLVPSVTAARLGETVGECDARYGKPTQVEAGAVFTNSVERTYSKDGFTIKVLFVDGRAEMISYLHPSKLTGEQVTKLLNNNARGQVWNETPNGSSNVYGSWETPKGATAEYFTPKPWESQTSSQYCLKISSDTFARLVKTENETQKKAAEHKKAEAAKQQAEAAKQREEQEQRERLKLLDKL